MITVEEAYRIIISHSIPLKTEEIDLENAVGRILAEDILADRDFPPFNRVMMDGVAIHTDHFNTDKLYSIQGIQAAGSPPLQLMNAKDCIEIMTGAVLPENTNAVIKYEETTNKNGVVKLLIDHVRPWQNIHQKGTDRKKGEIIISKGIKISPAEIGVAATVGKSTLKVLVPPSIAIFSTGDELVEVDENPKAHQIRKSNSIVLSSLFKKYNINSSLIHVNDKKDIIKSKLKKALDNNDCLILSGGVSKGKYDFIPEVLEELKVEKLFHKVKQRPGKPFWFGKSTDSKIVFALPGNPVSTFMCAHKYIIPWLEKSLFNKVPQKINAVLQQKFTFYKELQYFLQCKISINDEGELLAFPVVGKGSGDLANLVEADGFLELPRNKNEFKKGDVFNYISYRSILNI